MTSSKPGDDPRTEIIHDVDYPLDVPSTSSSGTADPGPTAKSATTSSPTTSSGSQSTTGTGSADTATTAMPVAGTGATSGQDTSSFGSDPDTSAFGSGTDTSTRAFPTDSAGAYGAPAPLPFGEQPATVEPAEPRDEVSRRGTTDLGLFLLRLAVGVLLTLRGLQKLFGLFGGPGIDGFAETLTEAGFEQAKVLAVAGGAVELVAGVMLVVGLATPIAAAGLLGLVGLGVAMRITGPEPVALLGETTRGLEASVLYAAALLALLFAGPGRWSADRRWRWSHRPRFSGVIWLVVAIAAAALIWYFLNGSNPLTSSVDSPPVTTGE